jgi:hypothetical protein
VIPSIDAKAKQARSVCVKSSMVSVCRGKGQSGGSRDSRGRYSVTRSNKVSSAALGIKLQSRAMAMSLSIFPKAMGLGVGVAVIGLSELLTVTFHRRTKENSVFGSTPIALGKIERDIATVSSSESPITATPTPSEAPPRLHSRRLSKIKP